MSSWFGSGLSHITGQISNFTKEVLEEGLEEVDDVATQLKITRNKFVELDGYCQAQKAEIERLKVVNDELQEKLEASELQVKTLSNEYRDIIERKEEELKSLKLQQNELYSLHSKALEVSPGTSPTESSIPHSLSMPSLRASYQGDEQDFDDVISSQHEINRLRNENSKLEAEVRHWKQRCHSETSRVAGGDSDKIHELQKQIKELQQQYDREIDQHQKELAALQGVHAQKLSTVKHRHKDEMAQLHEELAELRDKVSENTECNPKVLQELRDRVQHLEKVNQKLTVDLELTHAADREKARRLNELSKKLEAITHERDELISRYKDLQKENQELLDQLDAVVSERRQESAVYAAKQREQSPGARDIHNTSTGPSHSKTSDLSDIQGDADVESDNQVALLKKQISAYEEEIRQFEMVKSDWQMEKEALEDVLLNLREQLRNRDEKLSLLQHEQGSNEGTRQQGPEETLSQLSQQKARESEQVIELQKRCDNLLSERDTLASNLKRLKEELNDYQMSHKVEVEALHQQISELKQQLSTKVNTISELDECLKEGKKEQKSLLSSLNEKTSPSEESETMLRELEQKHEAISDVASAAERAEGEAEKKIQDIQRELVDAEEDRRNLKLELRETTSNLLVTNAERMKLLEENKELRSNIKTLSTEKDELIERVSELSLENERIKKEMAELREEQNGLSESLEELDAQHEAAMNQIIEARDRLLKENSELKARIARLESERKEEKEQLRDVQKLADDFMKLRSEQEKVAVKLNEVQLLNEQLSDNTVKLEEGKALLASQLHQLTKEKTQLQHDCDKLHEQARLAAATVETLREKVNHSEAENAKLRLSTASLEGTTSMSGTCQLERHRQLEAELAQLKELHSHQISDLSSRVDALQEQKDKVQRDLSDMELKAARQKQQFEQYQSQLESAQELDKHSLQAEYQKLLAEIQEKEKYINDLKQDLVMVREELTASRDTLNQLREEKEKLQAEVDQLRQLEKTYADTVEENKNFQVVIEKHQNSTEKSVNKGHQKDVESKIQLMTESETDSLQHTLGGQEKVKEYDELLSLKETIKSYEEEIAQLKQENARLVARIEELASHVKHDQLSNSSDINPLEKTDNSLSNREKLKQGASDSSLVKQINVIQNGDISDNAFNSSSSREEVEKMKSIVSQKDSLIAQLNDNNSSLLRLLEERSQAVYGDQTLVDIHHLENEVRSLRTEKDQIMSILNEKTRECSSLKSEVHRLMNVISAEKTALSKLQQDNQDLVRSKEESRDDPRQEMKQEAIKKLSQIIRDKDMEIEALNQKNQTLLQVLQDSSQEGSQIQTLMHEKDNLVQQISIFQKDREQIISLLNAKHSESVSYHEEIQRLNQLLAAQTAKYEQLQTEHASLKTQYEDKQHALVKMQNEMLNYKKKYTEIDMRFKELQLQKNRGVRETLGSPSPVPEDPDSATSSNALFPEATEELEDLRMVIRSHEDSFAEKDKIIRSQDQTLKDKDHAIWERDMALSEKDKQLSELHAKVHKAEESVHSKDSEISNFRKQCDNLSFQLKGVQVECNDLRQERDQLYERSSVLQQELGSLKEANNRLTMMLHDKEFEIRSLNEKVSTLSKLAETKGEGAQDEMQRVLKEMEAQQKQAQAFKQERDQSALAIQQQQAEIQQLRNEIQHLKEKGQKSAKELERLRGHLLTIEENYTQDALAAEEREKELRNKLAAAEEKVLSSSTAVQAANQQALKQVESLQSQLHVMAEQRDDALLQLSNAQETANQYLTSLQNLQMVLEQFQMERETHQNAEIEKYQKEIAGYKSEIVHLQDQVRQLQAQLDETADALEAAQRLSEQLDHKEEMIAALREEVQLRESELMKMEAEIQKLSSSSEGKVDKILMKNLILGYFHTPASSRGDALRLIGRMLDFSKSEMEQIGVEASRGWLGGFFRKSSPTPPSTPKANPNKSFSELFVNFLERESSPQPNIRLPVERMAAESQRRHSHGHQTPSTPTSRSQPAFNPFSAPVNSTLPLQIGKDSEGRELAVPSHHQLIKPVAQTLPLLSAAVPESSPSLLMAPSSGLVMNSGAILRDVLQQ